MLPVSVEMREYLTPRSRSLLGLFSELVIHWIDTSVAAINIDIGNIITMVPVMVVNTFTGAINNEIRSGSTNEIWRAPRAEFLANIVRTVRVKYYSK